MDNMELVNQENIEREKQEKAALLLGTTSDSIGEIAVFTGTSARAILEWMGDIEFQKRVEHFQTARLAESRRMAYARKADRIESYSRDLQRLDLVMEARSRLFYQNGETDNTTTTGGVSGLVLHKVKAVGSGDMQQLVDEYEVDTALLNSRLQFQRQLATELGDYEPGPNDTGGGSVTITFTANTPGPEDELAHE